MPGRILALVDGSTHSDSVCQHAGWLASRLNATVDLLHALEPRDGPGSSRSDDPGPATPGGSLHAVVHLDAQRPRRDHNKARAVLDIASKTVQRSSKPFVNQRLWAGDLRANVARFADEFAGQTRVVVMGRCGRSEDVGLGGEDAPGRLGSQVERIVRASREPVLVVPRAFRPVARVALAYDAPTGGRPGAHPVVEHLMSSPAFHGLAVSVIHAGEDTAAMRAHLEEACRQLDLAGLAARAEILPGEPAAALRQVVERQNLDLLVMGAYSHSRLRHLVVGSTTRAILQACEVPALLVR